MTLFFIKPPDFLSGSTGARSDAVLAGSLTCFSLEKFGKGRLVGEMESANNLLDIHVRIASMFPASVMTQESIQSAAVLAVEY